MCSAHVPSLKGGNRREERRGGNPVSLPSMYQYFLSEVKTKKIVGPSKSNLAGLWSEEKQNQKPGIQVSHLQDFQDFQCHVALVII